LSYDVCLAFKNAGARALTLFENSQKQYLVHGDRYTALTQ